MTIFRSILTVYLTAALLTGCSYIVEGEVDYGKTLADQSIAIDESSCPPSTNSTPVSASTSRPCYEQLFRKYENASPIMPGETISLHLSAAFVEGSPEQRNINEFFSGESANAELAIVVNACEQGINGCFANFDPKADTEGRVVFLLAQQKLYNI